VRDYPFAELVVSLRARYGAVPPGWEQALAPAARLREELRSGRCSKDTVQ
jgi:hypothetical protein